MTRKIGEVARLIQIQMLEHIIIAAPAPFQSIPESMPVGDKKAQMFCHCPVLNHFGGVVVHESQGLFGRWPFISKFAAFRKRGLHKVMKKIVMNRDEFS
ncbi:MAG: hypothetical protein JO232_08020 [Verrucomicrobia bacterium]|nr:hypothetical protein [Verrucomicrobiota bacterium]